MLQTQEAQERFSTALWEACENAEAGFFFEEGGCWAMAQALFEAFQARGMSVQMRYCPYDFVHAWVQFGNLMVDYRGISSAPEVSAAVSLQEMLKVAAKYGCADSYESDLDWARKIVQTALCAFTEQDAIV